MHDIRASHDQVSHRSYRHALHCWSSESEGLSISWHTHNSVCMMMQWRTLACSIMFSWDTRKQTGLASVRQDLSYQGSVLDFEKHQVNQDEATLLSFSNFVDILTLQKIYIYFGFTCLQSVSVKQFSTLRCELYTSVNISADTTYSSVLWKPKNNSEHQSFYDQSFTVEGLAGTAY